MTMNSFSGFDVDDLETASNILEHHQYRPAAPLLPEPSPSATSARNLLSRMQLAQAMEQRGRASSAAPAYSYRSASTNTLVDWLMNDDWFNGGLGHLDIGEPVIGSPDTVLGGPFASLPLLPPSSLSPARPPPRPTRCLEGRRTVPRPTVEDIDAAYWHGLRRGALASTAASTAATANTHLHAHVHDPFFPAALLEGAPARNLYPSAAAAVPLDARLRRHWFRQDGGGLPGLEGRGRADDGGAASALVANNAAAPRAATTVQGSTSASASASRWDPPALERDAAAALPSSSASHAAAPPTFLSTPSPLAAAHTPAAPLSPAARNYLTDIFTDLDPAAAPAGDTAPVTASATARDRCHRHCGRTTAAAHGANLQSHATATVGHAVDDRIASNVLPESSDGPHTFDRNTSRDGEETLLSSPLELEAPGPVGGAVESGHGRIDTVNGGGSNEDEIKEVLPEESPGGRAAAATAGTDSPEDVDGDGNRAADRRLAEALVADTEALNDGVEAAVVSAAVPRVPPRRSRRQAAVRGLERISTALATNGMGGGSSDSEGNDTPAPSHRGRHRDASTVVKAKATAGSHHKAVGGFRKRAAPTIIARPTNQTLKEDPPLKEKPPPITCCICLDEPTPATLARIDGCSHPFCFACIEKWADQENTCPLCKARFFQIERVHRPKKRKGNGGGGAGGGDERRRKRVRHRDQRADVPGFTNPLEGIFASMEANGTWPTHIAQLLFSGLGASSLGGNGSGTVRSSIRGRHPAPRRTAAAPSPSAFAAVTARRQHERQHRAEGGVHMFGFQNSGGSVALSATSAAGAVGGSGLLGQSGQNYDPPGSSPVSVGRSGGLSAVPAAASTFIGAPAFTPHHRRRPFAVVGAANNNNSNGPIPSVEETPPWLSSATAGMNLDPRATSTLHYGGGMPSPSNFANSPYPHYSLNGEDDEELLSTLSPSSYIRRLHGELESSRGADMPYERPSSVGQYQFNAFHSYPPGRATSHGNIHPHAQVAPLATPLPPSDTSLGMYSYVPSNLTNTAPFRNATVRQRHRGSETIGRIPVLRDCHFGTHTNNTATLNGGSRSSLGRTVATALEIDSDDDDDVVEVIDVEA